MDTLDFINKLSTLKCPYMIMTSFDYSRLIQFPTATIPNFYDKIEKACCKIILSDDDKFVNPGYVKVNTCGDLFTWSVSIPLELIDNVERILKIKAFL